MKNYFSYFVLAILGFLVGFSITMFNSISTKLNTIIELIEEIVK